MPVFIPVCTSRHRIDAITDGAFGHMVHQQNKQADGGLRYF